MKIATAERNGVRVLECEGPLSLGAGGDTFDAAVRQGIAKGGGIVADLSRVPYIDSTGVATIVANVKRAAERGSKFKLVLAEHGAARKALEITGLHTIIEVYGDVDSALASFH